MVNLSPALRIASLIAEIQVDMDVPPEANHQPGEAHTVVPHRELFFAFPGYFRVYEEERSLPQVHRDDALKDSNLRRRYGPAETVFGAELLEGANEAPAALSKLSGVKIGYWVAHLPQSRVAEQQDFFASYFISH